MGFDVNKIIEESVKDVIDGDVLEEGTELDPENLEEDQHENDMTQVYTESVDYMKEYLGHEPSKK